jgi:hypothetical protein
MDNFQGVKKRNGETDWEFCWRCICGKIEGQLNCDWQDIVEEFELGVHRDTLRKAVNVGEFSAYKVAKYYEDLMIKQIQNSKSDAVKDIENKVRQLQIEKQKLKDQRTELNRLIRTQARWEQVIEILEEQIEAYEYQKSEYAEARQYESDKNVASLMLSDWHIGAKFDTYLESYDTDIAKYRVKLLKDDVIEYCTLHKIDTLYIEILGDMVSGIIHVNNRLAQCENIIQQNIIASEMLGELIFELAKVVPNIKLVYCVGNHGRVNADVKESIAEENFEYLIRYYLEVKLQNLPNIEWLDNEVTPEMCVYTLPNGRTIASIHGHRERKNTYQHTVKNLTDFCEDFRINEVHMGHFHNHQVINNVVVNGSMMGCDEYAQRFKFHADPSQTLRVYDKKGNIVTYEIILK